MERTQQLRRQQLAEGIARHRTRLYLMKITVEKVPLSMKERIANRIQEMTEELHHMEHEFHELNVQQIRDELKGKKLDSGSE